MGKININDLDRYEETHRPFKKTRRSKKKKRSNENTQENKVKHR
jgi:hypothetical protein|tara:strand:- start:394 stop:525 length:132 start_codon:yes stop_codon:yes gene_type:complete